MMVIIMIIKTFVGKTGLAKYPLGHVVLMKLKGGICVCWEEEVQLRFTLFAALFGYFSPEMHYIYNFKHFEKQVIKHCA